MNDIEAATYPYPWPNATAPRKSEMLLNRVALGKVLKKAFKGMGYRDANGNRIPKVRYRKGDPLKGAGRKDGRLDSTMTGLRYVSWSPGDSEATLDGEFTAVQLIAIAEWMRDHDALPRTR